MKLSDPVEYFRIEIVDNIFKFLKAKDLFEASTVSRTWYYYIGNSKRWKKNIQIKIKCESGHEERTEELLPLVNSGRNYENLDFQICSDCVLVTKQILEAHKGRLKSVHIKTSNFFNPTEVLDFLEYVESSVEELKLSDITTRYPHSDGRIRNFVFPKLKVLHTQNIQATLFHQAFKNVCKLKEFVLTGSDQSITSLKAIKKLLLVNVNLKKLSISGFIFYQIMKNQSVAEFKFKLEMLSVDYYDYAIQEKMQENFLNLLMKQAETLEVLKFESWMGVRTTIAAFCLPKLKKLTLKEIHKVDEDWQRVQIPINKSISKLIIENPRNLHFFKKLTESLPNLNCLKTFYLDLGMMEQLKKTHPNISELSTMHLYISSFCFGPRYLQRPGQVNNSTGN